MTRRREAPNAAIIPSMRSSWQSVVEDLRSRCTPAGLDLTQPFQVSWYNRAVDDAFKLPDFGKPSALGILIGNTRAIWPRFLETLRANRPRLDARHPLESYIEATVLPALEAITYRSEVRWAQDPPPRRVAMQRLAHLSGLAYLSPSHLNVHATYGPWIALRAAVVIDIDGPSGPPREPSNPCPDCESHCLPRSGRRSPRPERRRPVTPRSSGTGRSGLPSATRAPSGRPIVTAMRRSATTIRRTPRS